MDINTKVNIISSIIIPSFGMFGAIIGFFVGIYKERNNTKWKKIEKQYNVLMLVAKN